MDMILTQWQVLQGFQLSADWVTLAFVVSINLYVLVEIWLNHLQVTHITQHRASVPEQFSTQVTLEEHQKAADYSQAKLSLGRWVLVIDAIILLGLTLGGGFQSLYDGVAQCINDTGVWREVAFLITVMISLTLLSLPVSLYQTFGIEARFGFNNTSVARFISDLGKSFLLLMVLGVPLLWVILSIMTELVHELWWLYAWGVWMGFSLLMLWIYPTWIAPLFNRFTPLEEGEMKTRIEALLHKTGFDSNGIFVMDGSTRSGHGNAYFTGFGKNKRIVFFDTLLEKLSVDEVEAVLAHELGHFKQGHIKKRIVKTALMSLLGLAVLAWLMEQSAFYSGLGFISQSQAIALLLFMTSLPMLFFWLEPLSAYSSRKDEFEADAFAVTHSSASALTSALVKLYRDNAATLTPHPWYSAYHDSHPPAMTRIARLQSRQSASIATTDPAQTDEEKQVNEGQKT